MIDVELLRGNQQIIKNAARRRNQDIPIEKPRELDLERRNIIVELDNLRAQRNETSKIIGSSKEKSPDLIADMKNVGGRDAGSITAAQILQRFIQEGVAWAHLDIAGVTWSKTDSATAPKGGTGFGVRLLDRLVTDQYESR